jgi:hypothetical protein
MIGHKEPLRTLPWARRHVKNGSAVINLGVIASRARRQCEETAMRAGTVAS